MKHLFFTLIFVLGTLFGVSAQTELINFKVYDLESGPLPSALIVVKELQIAAVTDDNGEASIQLPNGNFSIEVSYLGYTVSSKTISVPDIKSHTIPMYRESVLFGDVTIFGSVADKDVPVTYTNIQGKALNEINYGQDMPFLLNSTPSAVATSDAGNGIGYTAIRIRGSDATRVSVSINGIPYNDAESHQTFWVDLPDFASSVDDAQIQRGVGTSVNGVSAMGASINLNTNNLSEDAFGFVNANAGSFNLRRVSAGFGTGRLNEHWFLEGRVSRLYSDGFIDRAFADLSSYFITSGWKGEHYTSIINVFSGAERTYQSWGGVPKDSLETNRTFNPYTYENQTDNYRQTHIQWHNMFELNSSSSLNVSLNYTKGKGYFEQLETDQFFSDYGVNDLELGDTAILSTDLVTQRWLDNHFAGANLRYTNQLTRRLELTAGTGSFYYTGRHFGDVIWSEWSQPFGLGYTYYDNNAEKLDANAFLQLGYDVTDELYLWGDAQVRTVSYAFDGPVETGEVLPQEVNYTFFNPKAGFSYSWNKRSASYVSLSVASKEPNRSDFVESSPSSRPEPEQLIDLEAGQRLLINGWEIMANIYYMRYNNQLILTGEVNDVGAATRTNVPLSYRTGVELAWTKWINRHLFWEGNAAFSQNKIESFNAFVDDFDTFTQLEESYDNVDIAFSPAVIAFNRLKYVLFKDVDSKGERPFNSSILLESKYVSKQYIDNTMNSERALDAYFTNDIQINLSWAGDKIGELTLFGRVNNVFNTQYEANAWVYRFILGGEQQQVDGYFPQAGVHFVGGLSWKW